MSFIENKYNGITFMSAPNIGAAHAFTTRAGGASIGVYSSLNLGVTIGDDPDNVRENFALVCAALDISDSDIVRLRQIHGSHVRVVTREDRCSLYSPDPYNADGLLTCDSGVALAVFTADCVPLLLHDPVRGVIGAVHAGWRGTAADIAGVAVRKMTDVFGCRPADIRAAIGPCISGCCYETGRDVPDALRILLGDEADICISARGEKYMVSLKDANRLLLTRAGLCDIAVSDECTACLNTIYWSHRVTGGKRGSQAAIIVMKAQ